MAPGSVASPLRASMSCVLRAVQAPATSPLKRFPSSASTHTRALSFARALPTNPLPRFVPCSMRLVERRADTEECTAQL